MSENESKTQEELKAEAENYLARLSEFRRQMNLKEVRMLKKCQESPEDNFGILAGIMWIHNRRQNNGATFDQVLEQYTEESIVEALKKVLPVV